jgi:hypothetical protein
MKAVMWCARAASIIFRPRPRFKKFPNVIFLPLPKSERKRRVKQNAPPKKTVNVTQYGDKNDEQTQRTVLVGSSWW